jgi:hypothetical protein
VWHGKIEYFSIFVKRAVALGVVRLSIQMLTHVSLGMLLRNVCNSWARGEDVKLG